MTTAILCATDLSMSPYVWFYADICKQNDIDYIIITKSSKEIVKDGYNIVTFVLSPDMDKKSRLERIALWLIWVKRTMRERGVNRIVVTPTNTAFGSAPILLFSRFKYLLDIRDYTNENSFLYRQIERAMIDKAQLVVISSKGFLKWLPKASTPVYTIHNMPYDAKEINKRDYKRVSDGRIVIGYIGYVNYFKINKRLIDALGNNDQYKLRYCGKISESCPLEKYTTENKVNNIEFTGPFTNESKPELYKTIDMINSIYGNDSIIVTSALPNKLYDAVIYKKPILAAKGTYLGEIIEKYQLGIAVDVYHDDLHTMIKRYWEQFDNDKFQTYCNRFFADVIAEQDITIKTILGFIRSKDR